ncbi:restriction endonuclease subunit S [Actinomadura rupiterrae]|uniref:restriction endonuclease subunit S n=1 Tax=Actinomadura rupiterrae TaxID=559627 RepID=UPI0020A6030E|nr:restriction endonuclease subunit S [Actinomadura rupiterrae]MCP2342026.1 type I restriction enzyme S subunit [Actinomadura rupiterrae]
MTRPDNSPLPYGSALPEHWDVVPLKHVAKLSNGYVFNSRDWTEYGTPIIRIENLNGSSDFNFSTLALDERYQITNGDLLYSWSGNPGTSFGPYRWSEVGQYYLNQHIFKIFTTIDKDWLYWSLKAATHWIERALTSGMIGMVHVTKKELENAPIPLPPMEEQRRIADFLELEVRKIDRAIDLHKRLQATLAEKTEATVEQLLLHGDTKIHLPSFRMPEAPFPTAFKIGKLKQASLRVDVGIAEAATHAYAASGVPLLRSTNIRANAISHQDMLYVEPWFAERNKSKYVRAGDILTVRTGNAGTSAVVPRDLDMSQTFTQLITTPSPDFSAEYLCHFLNSRTCRQYFESVSWGSAQKNISVPLLGNTPIPMPPPSNQRDIVVAIQRDIEFSSKLASLVGRAVSVAEERRQALITSAVTGQFDVSTASGRGVTE